jgi:hypothetical protein
MGNLGLVVTDEIDQEFLDFWSDVINPFPDGWAKVLKRGTVGQSERLDEPLG